MRMKDLFSKKDIFLIAGLLLVCGAVWLLVSLSSPRGRYVRITVDGREETVYSLSEDREVLLSGVGGTNLLRISDGKASITEADCPDKICVHTAPISKVGQTIVCLPHKLVAEVFGRGEAKLDGMAR